MTNVRDITKLEWQLITSSACSFQVTGQKEVKVTEQASKPSVDTKHYKIALPRESYIFDPVSGGKLYALAMEDNNAIGYDLV